MLLSPAAAPPAGGDHAAEPKLDGWRAIVEVTGEQVRVWSRTGKNWSEQLPELGVLGVLGDAVLDGEVVVVTPDGRADFQVLTGRLNSRARTPAVSYYAFDLLRSGGRELVERPWHERRAALDDLGLAGRTEGSVRTTIWSTDAASMHEATAAIGAEGTTCKRLDSPYRPGRSRHWLKVKHSLSGEFEVIGWRPSSPARPGGLILAEQGEPIGVATVALPDPERVALVDLLRRAGRHHPSGAVTIPAGCIVATVAYTSRTPTHGLLREAAVLAVRPAGEMTESPSARAS
jgi:bifunctional non-homologous end joining protein LigD